MPFVLSFSPKAPNLGFLTSDFSISFGIAPRPRAAETNGPSTDPQCLPAVTNPVILKPAITGGLFSFSIGTVTSRLYSIEYKTNLNDTDWQTYQTLSGDGSTQTVTTPLVPGNQKLFRFQVR